MKSGLEGRAVWNDAYQRHFDTCLGCMACVTACPSGVQYDRLLEAVRPQVERHGRRSRLDRLFRELIFSVFPYPDRLRALRLPIRAYQRTGLQRLARTIGLTKLLPARLAAMERLLPPSPSGAAAEELPERIPAGAGPARRRVGLLLGCVQRVFFAHVNGATARVLTAEGCEVRAPRTQQCCGALMSHAGREPEAAAAARAMIDVFESADVDQIVINAAGCGSAMKHYGELLVDDPQYAARARAFAAKCVDVAELLAELEPRAPRHPLPLKVAYHDACHLQHAQGVKQAPRRLLRTIPNLDLKEIAEADLCCGSAGIYNLVEPDAAAALRDRKVANVLRTEADVVASGNPGCLMQLQSGLELAGRSMRSLHWIELIDASIRGEGV
jgi:glycolate oxidase iron-sulfur subunit